MGAYSEDTLCVGMARIGTDSQQMVSGKMKELLDVDFGAPLHSFIIAGKTHVIEDEILALYRKQ